MPRNELQSKFIPVTQKLKVFVDIHRFPKSINLFKNSIWVANDNATSPVLSSLEDTNLEATTATDIIVTDDIKYNGGNERMEKELYSHSWVS